MLHRLCLDHRRFALLLALAALAMKLLVPAGFMVGVVDGRVTLQVCSGVMPADPVLMGPMGHGVQMRHDAPAHKGSHHSGAEAPCPYAALAQAAVAPVDPAQLLLAPPFAILLALRVVRCLPVRARPYLRPPSRAPPLLA